MMVVSGVAIVESKHHDITVRRGTRRHQGNRLRERVQFILMMSQMKQMSFQARGRYRSFFGGRLWADFVVLKDEDPVVGTSSAK